VSARRAAASLLAVFLGAPPLAHDVPLSLTVSLEARAGRLVASVDLAPAYPPDLRRQLGSGLTNVIALHFSVLPEHGDEPIAIYAREIDVLYDVWEETFGVTVKDRQSPQGRRLTFADWRTLSAFLASARDLDVAALSALGSERLVLVTRIEVNPVSKELLDRTRELIANPAAGSRAPGSPSRSVLGAMASYLLRRADTGSDVHFFRSRPFAIRDGVVR
jgi:uncharacterized membrane protein